MSHIFISYSKQDLEFVRYLRALLQAEGFPVWFDEELHPGDDWWGRLERQIVASDAFVVVMSTNSKGSKWVQRELLLAENRRIPVFPVLLSGEMWTNVADLQYADLRAGLKAKLPPRLLQSLRTIFQPSDAITPDATIEFTIQFGNILTYPADVVAFKYAAGYHGADMRAAELLIRAGIPQTSIEPGTGQFVLLEAEGALAAPKVLYVGTPRLRQIGYDGLTRLGRSFLSMLQTTAPDTEHLAMTVHGPGFGLDEIQALRSQFAGIVEALQSGAYPPALERISLVEFNDHRVQRMRQVLETLAEEVDYLTINASETDEQAWSCQIQLRRVASSGGQTAAAPPVGKHAFVLLTAGTAEDVFYYGIQQPVHARGLLCERVDEQSTPEVNDDLMRQIMERIATAAVVIADVSAPDVQLAWQIGYAWGCKRPVILIGTTREVSLFPGMPVTAYGKIRDLEVALAAQLDNL